MEILFAILICLLLTFFFWIVGYAVTKQLKIKEENRLLDNLISIALGFSFFLILTHLISRLLQDFNLGVIITFVLLLLIIIFQFKNLIKDYSTFKFSLNKKNADPWFWLLLIVINFIYGIKAFTTIGLNHFEGSTSHIFNINQLISGTYPPKYSFLATIEEKYHYGADILGATISKFSTVNPEISLDILTILFLNLCLLTIIALTNKFVVSDKPSKYIVPFAAFLAWIPIAIFSPLNDVWKKPLEKITSLSQSEMSTLAEWSGLVLNWFFEPSCGFGTFFFLIALYLLYKVFFQEKSFSLLILFPLSIFISSLIVIDIYKLILLLLGLLFYIFFSSHIPFLDLEETTNKEQKMEGPNTLKKFSILLATVLFLGLLYGNWLTISKDSITAINIFNVANTHDYYQFGPLKSNLVLILIYCFGFFFAFKAGHKWCTFLFSFFIVSFLSPLIFSITNQSSAQITMAGNLIGAFSLPFAIDFIRTKFDIKENKLAALYIGLIFVFSFSTLMLFAFGDKSKPLFYIEKGTLKFTGMQSIPYTDSQDEGVFIKFLRSKKTNNSAILTEPAYAELFSTATGLINPVTVTVKILSSIPVNVDAVYKHITLYIDNYYPNAFSFDNKSWLNQNIKWVYITPRFFKSIMCPQTRTRFLNSYFEKASKLVYSNEETIISKSKELFNIEPKLLRGTIKENYPILVKEFLASSKPDTSFYLKQIALCPYLGIYNAMSNDFDGDKISDVAFFDEKNKKWFIIHGKDQKEEEIDLTQTILKDDSSSDLFIPLPSDYDGDSKTDIALFNRNTALWSILPTPHSEKDEREEGPFELEIKFKGGESGKTYPLFVTGRNGAADVVYVGSKNQHEIYFGFDHWGAAPAVSETIKINPDRFYKIEISLGNIYTSASTNPDLLTSLLIKLDGKEVFKVKASFNPTTKEQITIGKNDVGASTCSKEFPGIIKNVHRLVVYETRKWGGAVNEFPLPAYLDDDNFTDFSVFTGENRVKWPTLLSSNNYNFRDYHFGVSYLDTQVFGDVDGDKKDDFIVYSVAEGSFTIYLSTKDYNESSRFIAKMSEKDSKLLPRVVAADYDGDKKVDLALWYPEDGKWEIAYAKDLVQSINQLPSNTTNPMPFIGCGGGQNSAGNNITCSIKTFYLGDKGDIPMPGDYDGNGTVEIAVLDSDTYNLEIAFSNGLKKTLDLSKYKNLTPASFIGI